MLRRSCKKGQKKVLLSKAQHRQEREETVSSARRILLRKCAIVRPRVEATVSAT